MLLCYCSLPWSSGWKQVLGCISFLSLFFFFLFWPPWGMWSSWARDQIQTTVATYAAVTVTLDPLNHTVPGQGSNLCPGSAETPMIPLCHSGVPSCRFCFLFSPSQVICRCSGFSWSQPVVWNWGPHVPLMKMISTEGTRNPLGWVKAQTTLVEVVGHRRAHWSWKGPERQGDVAKDEPGLSAGPGGCGQAHPAWPWFSIRRIGLTLPTMPRGRTDVGGMSTGPVRNVQ